jgi:hypothetical protein
VAALTRMEAISASSRGISFIRQVLLDDSRLRQGKIDGAVGATMDG